MRLGKSPRSLALCALLACGGKISDEDVGTRQIGTVRGPTEHDVQSDPPPPFTSNASSSSSGSAGDLPLCSGLNLGCSGGNSYWECYVSGGYPWRELSCSGNDKSSLAHCLCGEVRASTFP